MTPYDIDPPSEVLPCASAPAMNKRDVGLNDNSSSVLHRSLILLARLIDQSSRGSQHHGRARSVEKATAFGLWISPRVSDKMVCEDQIMHLHVPDRAFIQVR